MWQKSLFPTFLCLCCILCNVSVNLAQESTTQKAVPLDQNATTTEKPKIDVLASALCKKCICDENNKQLNCNNTQMSEFFTDEEWDILQNGDIIFETIKLDHNNISLVPQLRTYSVKNLYLSFNRIAKIEMGAFRNLTNLTILDLSHNKLTSKTLVPDVFQGLYSPQDFLPLDDMRELDLGYNELHTLDSDLFEHLPNLETLILCKNTFQVIDQQTTTAISGLTSLKTLDMSYMELSNLPNTFLHGPRDLQTLILTGNLFKTLPNDLNLAINLQELILDENLITEFGKENVFPNLTNLRYLSISYMPDLTKIDNGSLSNLPNLTTFIASNNPKLIAIDGLAFARTTTNEEIYDYPPLTKLYLHNNNLTLLERDLLMRWDKIEIIDLRFNPWACDCNNRWLIHTLIGQINLTTPQFTNDVNCNSPPQLKNLPLLKLYAERKTLLCNTGTHPERDGLILVSLLVMILIAIPMVFVSIVIYRRGCFGLVHRGGASGNGLIYSRANFNEDMHM